MSNWLSYYNLDFINLDSTIYITTSHKTSWLNQFLIRWDLIFRDWQLEIQRYVQKSKFKTQTQRTCVLDQVRISNEEPPCRGRRSIRPRSLQIESNQHFDCGKRPDFVGIKLMVVIIGIAVLNRAKVIVVTSPNMPDTFSNHIIVTYCAFFKRSDSPNLHCIGNGVNFTVLSGITNAMGERTLGQITNPTPTAQISPSARSLWRG